MSIRAQIEEQASQSQRRAADPKVSAWVSASAGSGKTKVLADRILTLMLAGVPPERLLCLTFTKAAASEMANRVQTILSRAAVATDEALDDSLRKLLGRAPTKREVVRARSLFARVLDAPGGLKAMTLHAFCQSVLRRFPLEANVAPHFEVMDDRAADEALEAAKLATFARAEAGDEALARALAVVAREVNENDFSDLIGALMRERGRLRRLIGQAGGVAQAIARTAAMLGLTDARDPEAVIAEASAEAAFDRAALKRAAAALAQGSKTDQEKAAQIASWIMGDDEERAQHFADYRGVFLTQKNEPRKNLATASVAAMPGVQAALAAEAERLVRVLDRVRKAKLLEATAALLTLGGALLVAYAREKATSGRLDYDDLVLKCAELLARPGVASWVQFKLDGGVDHILIDEGQDTNPDQWRVVAQLAEEFFVGRTAGDEDRALPRTIFAVGDAKQSIFSFQRADPAAFEAMRAHFRAKVEDAGRGFEDVPLEVSFRSAAPVLEAVDRTFALSPARDGVVADGARMMHVASRQGVAGLVELWPPLAPVAPPPQPSWALPVERVSADDPQERLAKLIAHTIRGWLDRGEILPSKARAIAPGDVMILVRRRGGFAAGMVRALKAERVAVAGVDRMVLPEQIAVMDLIALGRFLLLPEDDLTLACVLKGPLVGLDEEALFRLAHGRKGSLVRALADKSQEEDFFARAFAFLRDLLARVDFARPYELYAELLGRGGEKRILSRLGADAEDPLEEFLALALSYERAHTPSLEGFLAWVEAGAAEIKRDLDRGTGAVRVMTVHGAKGLEAPIVFLPDTMGVPPAPKPPLLWLKPSGVLLWPPRRADQDEIAQAAYAQRVAEQTEEFRRLLYVAMTRAADRLYVCGFLGKKAAPAGHWHELISAALEPVAKRVDAPYLAGATALRIERPQEAEPERDAPAADERAQTPLPDWARRPAPDAEAAGPMTPSRPEGEEPPALSPFAARDRFRRGLLIHQLLQILPDLPARRRAAACRRFLSAPTHGIDEEEQEEIATTVLALLAEESLAPLFGPGSLAEAPLVGRIATARGPVTVSGQVDRLLVEPQRVVVIDYKTNRPPARTEAEVSRVYLRQMAAYRALLVQIYPGRSIGCALLWTTGPRLMWLSDERLDAAAPGRAAIDPSPAAP